VNTVVTGASGHIGANLIRTLLREGERNVRVVVHVNQHGIEGLGAELVCGDICELSSLVDAFQDAEVVYHLAARIALSRSDWPVLEAVNIKGTENVVEACLRCGVRRLVHFSSIHALEQEPFNVPLDESRPLTEALRHPPYNRSKAGGERAVQAGIERGLDAITVIPTAVIGPHDYQPSHFGEVLLGLACRKLPALVTGGFDWVDARDVAQGAMCAEKLAPTGERYLLSGHWASIPEVASMAREITGVPCPGLVLPEWLARVGLPLFNYWYCRNGKRPLYHAGSLEALRSNRCISHQKASNALGYQPRPFQQTLEDTYRWFMENGYLSRPVS